MPLDRIRSLHAIADAHPEMPLRDALTATALDPHVVAHMLCTTDDWRWCLFAASSLQGIVVRGDHTPEHLTDQACRYADMMCAAYRKRFESAT